MVKFSHGCWHPAADTLIDWAVEVFKSEAKEDSIRYVTVSYRLIEVYFERQSNLTNYRVRSRSTTEETRLTTQR